MAISGYTENYRLRKVTFNTRGWHLDHWYNLDVIDGVLSSVGDGSVPFAETVGGTGDAITLDFTPNVAYTNGQLVSFIATAANTTTVTVNCDGLGAKDLKSASGAALSANTITDGMYIRAIFSSADDCFTLIYPSVTAAFDNIFSSGSSGVTSPADADDLTVENSANAGIAINTPAGFIGRISMGRPLSPSAGQLRYDHATDKWHMYAGGNLAATIDSNGNLTITGELKTANSFVYVQQAYTAATNLPTTGTKIKFGTIRASNGDGAYDTGTGEYTVPVAGYYLIYYSVAVYAAAGSGNTTLAKYTPGTTYLSTDTQCLVTTDSVLINPTGLTQIWHLDAGDKIAVEYTGTSATKWKGHLAIVLLQADNA